MNLNLTRDQIRNISIEALQEGMDLNSSEIILLNSIIDESNSKVTITVTDENRSAIRSWIDKIGQHIHLKTNQYWNQYEKSKDDLCLDIIDSYTEYTRALMA